MHYARTLSALIIAGCPENLEGCVTFPPCIQCGRPDLVCVLSYQCPNDCVCPEGTTLNYDGTWCVEECPTIDTHDNSTTVN